MKIEELKLIIKNLKKNKYLLPVSVGIVVVLTVVVASFLILQSVKPSSNIPKTSVLLKPTPTPYVQKTWTVMVTRGIAVPKTLTMKKGGTLNVLNVSQGPIDIESEDVPANTLLNLGVIPFGAMKEVVMPNSGTYKYTNKLNPKEQGIIIVQ